MIDKVDKQKNASWFRTKPALKKSKTYIIKSPSHN